MDDTYTVDEHICRMFQANPSVNPFTGRKINVNAKTGMYQWLKKQCEKFGCALPPHTPPPPVSSHSAIPISEEIVVEEVIVPENTSSEPVASEEVIVVNESESDSESEEDVVIETSPEVAPLVVLPPDSFELSEVESPPTTIECLEIIHEDGDTVINPLTGRRIKKGGATWKKLQKKCEEKGVDIVQDSKKVCKKWIKNGLVDPVTGEYISLTSDRYGLYLTHCEKYRAGLMAVKREELLALIEDNCSNKEDPLTGEVFADMSLEDLDSVVCLGCDGNKPGMCYSLDTVYKHYELAVLNGVAPTDPLVSSYHLTDKEIEDINQKMLSRNPLYQVPKSQLRRSFNLELVISNQDNFYHVRLMMRSPDGMLPYNDLGYIPSNLNISHTAIELLVQLFDEGKLLNSGSLEAPTCCTVSLRKTRDYWTMDDPDNSRRLLQNMIDELRGQL